MPARRRPTRLREAATAVAEIDAAPPDRGVTIARAAEYLGCDPSTVRRLLDQGALTGWRVAACASRHGEPRVSLASIDAWRAARAIAPRNAIPAARAAAAQPAPVDVRAPKFRESVAFLAKLGLR